MPRRPRRRRGQPLKRKPDARARETARSSSLIVKAFCTCGNHSHNRSGLLIRRQRGFSQTKEQEEGSPGTAKKNGPYRRLYSARGRAAGEGAGDSSPSGTSKWKCIGPMLNGPAPPCAPAARSKSIRLRIGASRPAIPIGGPRIIASMNGGSSGPSLAPSSAAPCSSPSSSSRPGIESERSGAVAAPRVARRWRRGGGGAASASGARARRRPRPPSAAAAPGSAAGAAAAAAGARRPPAAAAAASRRGARACAGAPSARSRAAMARCIAAWSAPPWGRQRSRQCCDLGHVQGRGAAPQLLVTFPRRPSARSGACDQPRRG